MGLFGIRKKKKQDIEEAEPRKWSDVGEEDKFVINGGKVQCPFCTTPIADIIVTSNTVSLQGKYYATTADCDGKINLDFKGQCTAAPGITKPPCKSVIQLGKWKDYSDTFINDDNALLVRSAIPCMINGQDLKIVHSGQIEVLTNIEPRVIRNHRVTRMFWVDAETNEKVKKIELEQNVKLCFVTQDYDEGETVKATVKRKSGKNFNNNKKELIFTGIVDAEGLAISVQNYENTINEEK